MKWSRVLPLALLSVSSTSFAANAQKEQFGRLDDGTAVEAVTLTNGHGMRARVIAWGAILQQLVVPGKDGPADVVLGYDGMKGYLTAPNYFGATVGRYANRIAKGHFELDGHSFQLATNDGPNALHGGVKGFDKHLWTIAHVESRPQSASVTLVRTSPDGEEGYPGTMQISATFTLTENDELQVDYKATTDKPTIVNITNHSFFNLAGQAAGRSATNLVLTIPAQSFTPVDSTLIPTGEFRPVAGTPFDFRSARRIGDRVRDGADEQLRLGRGYDHNWVVTRAPTSDLHLMAKLEDPRSDRVMELMSNQPGLQVYTGNFLDATVTGKSSVIYRQGDAVCLEPQTFPDTPNKPQFGSAELNPGETYENRIVYRFSMVR